MHIISKREWLPINLMWWIKLLENFGFWFNGSSSWWTLFHSATMVLLLLQTYLETFVRIWIHMNCWREWFPIALMCLPTILKAFWLLVEWKLFIIDTIWIVLSATMIFLVTKLLGNQWLICRWLWINEKECFLIKLM